VDRWVRGAGVQAPLPGSSNAPRSPSFGGPVVARHEIAQDPVDQFGHAEPLVEREMAEPAAGAARDRNGELHRFHCCVCLPAGGRHGLARTRCPCPGPGSGVRDPPLVKSHRPRLPISFPPALLRTCITESIRICTLLPKDYPPWVNAASRIEGGWNWRTLPRSRG